ncbi:MAG: hypothetical protein R3E32_27455 [Chitinophagales bacterium]
MNVQLAVLKFIDDGIHFFFVPALDIVGYGQSESEAETSFGLSLEEFIEYTLQKNTYQSELQELGWSFSDQQLNPPTLDYLIAVREDVKEIVQNKEFNKIHHTVFLPSIN